MRGIHIFFRNRGSICILCRNSTVRYTSRINYDVACQMDFHAYPGDRQTCDIKLESFGFTADQIQFDWADGGSNVNENISLAQFSVMVLLKTVCLSLKTLNKV